MGNPWYARPVRAVGMNRFLQEVGF